MSLVVAAAAAMVTSLLLWSASAGAESPAQIVSVINAERQANGLPAVREDPALSAGCAQYDNYRRINGTLQDAFTLHGEEASKTGYTPAGATAAHDSLLNAGDRPADSFAAGDVFDDAPNHLVALMDPAVAVIGADQTDFELGIFGTVSLSCVDVRTAPRRAKPRRLHVYTYVGPGGKAPRNPSYREGPAGHGTFVFLYFDAPRNTRIALTRLRFRHRNGAVAQPTFLEVTGGLIDGRHAARRAVSQHVGELPTPTVVARDNEEAEQEEDIEDFMEWTAEELRKGFFRGVVAMGAPPITFK